MNKLSALQILRGIAASLVVVDHSILRHAEWSEYPGTVTAAAHYSGTLGVAVFFVISGYIMIHTAGSQFGKQGAAAAFLHKRIVRIVPLYWLATLLEIAFRLRKGGTIDPQFTFASFFFIPQSVEPGDYMRPLLGVGWTLNYEMFFYVVFAIALMFRKTIGLGFLFSALVSLVVLGMMSKPLADTSPPYTILGYWTDPIILLFAAGVALGFVPLAARRHAAVVAHPVVVAVILLTGCAALYLTLDGSNPTQLFWQTGTWLLCALAVALCIFGRQSDNNAIVRAGVKLGDISYALYLFHFFAVVATEKMWWFFFGKSASILFILAAYCASVAAAYAIHHLIEVKIGHLLARRPPRPAPQPAIKVREADAVADAVPYQQPQPARRQATPLYGRK